MAPGGRIRKLRNLKNEGENSSYSLEGGGGIVGWDCFLAGEVLVVVQMPGEEDQEPTHPSASRAQDCSEK